MVIVEVVVPDMLLTLLLPPPPPPLLLLVSLGVLTDFRLISVGGTDTMLFLEGTAE